VGHILYDLDKKDKYIDERDAVISRREVDTRNNIQPLPGALHEVVKIDSIGQAAGLSTTMLIIDAASEDTIQYFVGERAPSIFHFATHGVSLLPLEKQHQALDSSGSRDRLRAAKNPLQHSALMLSGANQTWTEDSPIIGSDEDGILTALEITALDLQKTDLVVLAACVTGLGNVHHTEGVFGLQRAFKLHRRCIRLTTCLQTRRS